ncbi:hypothetical protein X975_08027, partial [Stegodyphus mimosarum]
MERYKPQQQPQQKQGVRINSNNLPQFIDLQKLSRNHLRGLQDVILQTKDLPLSQLNFPVQHGKPLEIIQISLQELQQNGFNHGRQSNRYNRIRNAPRNKVSYNRIPQNRIPSQPAVQFEYLSVPKIKSVVPKVIPKEIEVTPIKLPQPIHPIDDILGIKNIQVVEVPVPPTVTYGVSKAAENRAPYYGQRESRPVQIQYKLGGHKTQQKVRFPPQFSYQADQLRGPYAASQHQKSNYIQHQQPEIEAELIKLSEEEIQNLLSKLQVIDSKDSQNLLKYFPIGDLLKPKGEELQLIVALPQAEQGQSPGNYQYEIQKYNQQSNNYAKKGQYTAGNQQLSYPSHSSTSVRHNSGGYQIEKQNSVQEVEHNAAGYQVEDESLKSGGDNYEQSGFQSLGGQAGYGQQSVYQGNSYESQNKGYEVSDQQSGYSQDQDVTKNEYANHRQQEPTYIQVLSPQADENGYRREPVLAVEIKHGQSIEDAIKSLDPETLQRLGSHGKEGLEIEVVEIPVDEYTSESKKVQSVVSSNNSTIVSSNKNSTVILRTKLPDKKT